MAVSTFPSITPEIQDFGIEYNVQVSTSWAGSTTQRLELPGARWKARIGFTDMTPSESAALKAFLLELRGMAGSFYYGDLTHTTPFNTVIGTPTIESPSTRSLIRVTLDSSSESFSVLIIFKLEQENLEN